MIEPAWNWLKRRTTARGAPKKKEDAIRAWKQAWKDLDQQTIQKWINRIVRHIKKVIELEGGNEYKEGEATEDERESKGRYKKGELSQRVYYDDARKGVGAQVDGRGSTERDLGENDGFEDGGDDEGDEAGRTWSGRG